MFYVKQYMVLLSNWHLKYIPCIVSKALYNLVNRLADRDENNLLGLTLTLYTLRFTKHPQYIDNVTVTTKQLHDFTHKTIMTSLHVQYLRL